MFSQSKKTVVVVAVAGALATSSFLFGGFTSKPSSADVQIDRTAQLVAQEDAVVTSSKPSLNQASGAQLVAQSSEDSRSVSYVKFDVTSAAIGTGKLVGAKVLLTPQQVVTTPAQLRTVSSSEWSAQSLTFNNAPAVGAVVGEVSQGPATTRWIDVTAVVTAPGTYTFALTAENGTATFASAETSNAPTLLLRIQDEAEGQNPASGGGPTATPKPTNTQTKTQTKTKATQPVNTKPQAKPTTNPGGCKKRFPGDPCAGTMYYGASTEGGDPRDLESTIGRRLALFRSYMQPTTPASKFASRAAADVAAGRIPLISTKTPGTWASVAAGQQDAWLIERIKALAAVDGPVWLCLHHEPRNDGDPADWVKMQQHARTLIDKYADNIALVGILNGWDFLEKNGNPERWNMPVGTGVDIMGFDSYNPYTPTNGRPWKTAERTLQPGLEIQGWGYPTLVAETGVHTDPAHPQRAATWLRDEYQYALAHHFLAISYFNSTANSDDGGWTLTGERLTAFTQNLTLPTVANVAN